MMIIINQLPLPCNRVDKISPYNIISPWGTQSGPRLESLEKVDQNSLNELKTHF